ncbi:MAG: FkbM family methyltransferase [Dehalococcoidia bacterium]|nr:FkbM family methyltransferase [Dehalococcoidia bacterium]
MKVIHFAEFSPHACGLYHTTKDLVKAEIGQGIDAHFVDVTVDDKGKGIVKKPGSKDGWLTTSDISIADDADILVRHTMIPNELENSGIPLVMAIHGRPESSFLLDEQGHTPVVEGFHNKGKDCRYKAFFTFWKEHIPFWSKIIPTEKLHYVPAMVDLMEWRPGGEKFDFGKLNGNPNILIADVWRDDVRPFNEVMAVAEWIKMVCPSARLHIAAAPTGKGANVLWRKLREEGVLGYASGQTSMIKKLYAACDVVVTPHTIATRIIRESCAMAIPVIKPEELTEWWKGFQENRKKQQNTSRKYAETNFRLSNAGAAAKEIYESVLNKKPSKRKVLIDIGGHLGETIRRFYREVEDARFYEIHTFEPVDDCFVTLKKNTERMKNVKAWQNAVVGTDEDYRNIFVGSVNDHEGSTMVNRKITGGVNYDKPLQVPAMNLSKFIHTNFRYIEDHSIVLKMNIEGGEYELMQHIIKENLMPYFSQIYIGTHKCKIEGETAYYVGLEKEFAAEAEKNGVQLFMQEKGMARFQCSQS